jgi:MraZ protein
MAFQGHYEHSLDAKHRLSIPSRFRNAFSDGIVLSKDTDACLTVWTADGQQPTIQRALEGKNPLGREYKQIQRFFQANSFPSELDGSGRVIVPPPLLAHAGIEKEVIVAGVGDHLEVWSSDRWADEQAVLDAGIGEVTEGLGDPS